MIQSQDKGTTLNGSDLRDEVVNQAQRIRQREARKPPQPDNAQSELSEMERLLQEARVRPTDQINESPRCLSIESNGEQAVIGTAGNFTVVIGAAKVRKSFLVAAAVAAYLNPFKPVMGCVRGHLLADKPGILLIDTEQGRFHVLRSIRRICQLAEVDDPIHLQAYALRQYDTRQRLALVRHLIEHTPDIGLVVLDGARDIVFSINSEEEATATATMLLQLTEQKGIHLLTVLHTNKGVNADARGHLGAELINKAETVLRISKDPSDKNVSVVTPEHCRDRDFELFAFSINEEGLPYRVDELPEKETQSRKDKPTAASLKVDEVEAILRRAFVGAIQLRYSQLRTNLIEASESIGRSLAKNRAEGLIRRVETEGYLIKSRSIGQKYDVYHINPEKLPV